MQSAILNVNDAIAATPLTDKSVYDGGGASFTTTAIGTAPYNFVWKHGTDTLASGGKFSITTVGGVSTLMVSNVGATEAGAYSVAVSDSCGTAVTRTAQLGPEHLRWNPGTRRTDGLPRGNCDFHDDCQRDGPVSFTWAHGPTPLSNDDKYTISTVGAVSTLVVKNASSADEGPYQVTVSGPGGSRADALTVLTVLQGVAATPLIAQTVCPGMSARFTTTASGRARSTSSGNEASCH